MYKCVGIYLLENIFKHIQVRAAFGTYRAIRLVSGSLKNEDLILF